LSLYYSTINLANERLDGERKKEVYLYLAILGHRHIMIKLIMDKAMKKSMLSCFPATSKNNHKIYICILVFPVLNAQNAALSASVSVSGGGK